MAFGGRQFIQELVGGLVFAFGAGIGALTTFSRPFVPGKLLEEFLADFGGQVGGRGRPDRFEKIRQTAQHKATWSRSLSAVPVSRRSVPAGNSMREVSPPR